MSLYRYNLAPSPPTLGVLGGNNLSKSSPPYPQFLGKKSIKVLAPSPPTLGETTHQSPPLLGDLGGNTELYYYDSTGHDMT